MSTNPDPDLYPFWAEPEDLRRLTDAEKRAEWRELFYASVRPHADDLHLFRGTGPDAGRVFLGWFRTDAEGGRWVQLRAVVHGGSRTLAAVALRRQGLDDPDAVDWARPVRSGPAVYDEIVLAYRLIVPAGTF